MFLEGGWEPRQKVPVLEPGTVHVVHFRLERSAEGVAALARHLDGEEEARAARFKREIHQRRFRVGRGQLRVLLGLYTGQSPRALQFRYNAHGKPALAEPGDALNFNLSHSEDEAILAVWEGRALGVDIEHRDPRVRMESIAHRFFRPEEAALLAGQDDVAKADAFYQLWTAKEALLKGVGGGLTLPLNQCAFSLDSVPLGLTLHGLPTLAEERWQVYPLQVVEGYGAALAVSGGAKAIHGYRWQEEG